MRRLGIILAVAAAAVVIDGKTLREASGRLLAWSGPDTASAQVHTEVAIIRALPAAEGDDEAFAGVITEEEEAWEELPPDREQPLEARDGASPGDDPPETSAEPEQSSDPPEASAEPEQADPPRQERPLLVSVARETWVYAEPRWGSRRLGYLRAGSLVTREAEPATYRSCRRGWYRIEPRGFVCLNRSASLEPDHPVARLSSRQPEMGGLPYLYVTSRHPTPPLYARLPSEREQQEVESGLSGHLAKIARLSRSADFEPPPPADPIPPLLAEGGVLPGLGGADRGAALSLGRARIRSGFALLGSYEHEGRRFGLTTEMALIPLDRTRVVAPSTLRGVRLSDELSLPIGIVTRKHARRWVEHPESGSFALDGQARFRSVVGLTGNTRRRSGTSYHEALDGSWLRAEDLRRIDRFTQAPKWALQGKKWIDVSILRQSLVAYEGTRPVYATLVSTGADGLADHEDSHATIQGTFLIHTKHVSVTMDGDEDGDEFDLRDVPFVQYFTEGYALHGAYWHDDFGRPRSHGCVNLAPVDAAWLFRWTDPEVPAGWHAALSLKKGTVVYIHP